MSSRAAHIEEDDVGAQETQPLLPRRESRDRQRLSQRPKLVLRSLVALLFAIFIVLVVLLVVVPSKPSRSPQLDSRGRLNPAHLASGHRGGVASENAVCSQIGVDLMKRGGTAADAAVGATLCIGTLNMFSSGIGGGGFALIRSPITNGSAESEHVTIDFRETAPAAAFPEMFHGRPDLAKIGGLSVGVPGELRGLEEIWKRWGKLSWKEVVEPSVHLAKGAKVSRELARKLGMFGGFMIEKPEWEEVFFNHSTGQFLKEGDTIRRTAYANTLQAIADGGSDVFYSGPIAESILAKIRETGGVMTARDLRDYSIEIRPAMQGTWTKGRRVWTTPMPTSGSIVLQMMNVLQKLGFEEFAEEYRHIHHHLSDAKGHELEQLIDRAVELQGLWAHRSVEVMKHAYASRTRLGDPAFLNTSALLEASKIPTDRKARQVLSRINDDKTFPLEYYDPLFDIPEDHGTTHVSVTDDTGLSVGITSTVNLGFGSQEMDRATGIILNDEMDDSSTPGEPNAFGLRPSPYNYPEPNKRPLSSISPIIIEDHSGHFQLLLGGAGGSMIPTSILQSLLNIELGYNLSEAIEKLRIHHQLLPQQIIAESSIVDGEIVKGIREVLKKKGHLIFEWDINSAIAVVQGVQKVSATGEIRAASDSRKNGWAAAW
ncbi:unnamed protein product [Sympodiomycopsis kandeliae]